MGTSQQGVLLPRGSQWPRGPGNWERQPHGCQSSGPCASSVTPGAIWGGPESQGRPSAGPGWELQECVGQKGPLHLTHQGSSSAVIRGREQRTGRDPEDPPLHHRGQDPSSRPAASRPCAEAWASLWPSPVGHLDL